MEVVTRYRCEYCGELFYSEEECLGDWSLG